MEIKIEKEKLKPIKDALKAANAFLTEVTIKHNSTGLHLFDLDKANVCGVCIDIDLPNISETEFMFGINLDELNAIMSHLTDETIITIKDNLTAVSGTKVYTMPIIQPDSIKNVPKLEYDGQATIVTKAFNTAIKEIDVNGMESVQFSELNNDAIKIVAKKGELYKAETNLLCASTIKGSAKYSLDYINKFKLISDLAILKFKTDYPLVMQMDVDIVHMKYILAPRVS